MLVSHIVAAAFISVAAAAPVAQNGNGNNVLNLVQVAPAETGSKTPSPTSNDNPASASPAPTSSTSGSEASRTAEVTSAATSVSETDNDVEVTESAGAPSGSDSKSPTKTIAPPGDSTITATKFPYDTEKIRGVNIGGWLLLEGFITPTLFDETGNEKVIDEYTFTKLQDKATAEAALKKHWDTFITEQDFADIAAAGLNHVRIPIGYWAYDLLPDETYIGGQDEYLEKAIGWCKTHGIKVLIDLHGLPESQNGFDNSGQTGDTNWPNKAENIRRSVDVIGKIAQKYSAPEFEETVTAINLVNEPAGFRGQNVVDATKQFYLEAYQKARYPWEAKADESSFLIVLADAFVDWSNWDESFMPKDTFVNIAMDTHYYQIFQDDMVAWSPEQHLKEACSLRGKMQGSPRPVMAGEWSVAITDCAKYLNGRGKGARFEGTFSAESKHIGNCSDFTGDGSNFSEEYKETLAKYFGIQSMIAEETGMGWLYWTWKTESAAEWSYKRGRELGWIPMKAGDHRYSLDEFC